MIVTRPPEPTFYEGYVRGAGEVVKVVLKSLRDTRTIALMLDPDSRTHAEALLAMIEQDIADHEFLDEADL